MSTIAFIGLGIMGGPMSQRLADAGHTVLGFNRSSPPVEQLVATGGKVPPALPKQSEMRA